MTEHQEVQIDRTSLAFIGLESGKVLILICELNWYKPKICYYEVIK